MRIKVNIFNYATKEIILLVYNEKERACDLEVT